MKKVLSFIMAVVILLSIAVVPVFAEATENNYLYEDKFIEYYVDGQDVSWAYEEVYYHYSESQEIDWCLIYGRASNISADAYIYLSFNDFVLYAPNRIRPFSLQYAVYDVKKETFVDLVKGYVELEQYDGLIDVLRELDRSIELGDSDEDGELTILDATDIQNRLAGIPYKCPNTLSTDARGEKYSLQDFDKDEQITIFDATAIQMKLAKAEETVSVE